MDVKLETENPPDNFTRAVHWSRSAGAPIHFAEAGAGVGKLQQKLWLTKL